jgi:hypothetical protein
VSYENERRVKLYTRKTREFLDLGWEGRLVLFHMYCVANVLGRIEIAPKDELRDVAKKLELPEELLAVGLPRLLDGDVVRWEPAEPDGVEACRPERRNVRIGWEGGEFVIVEFVEQQQAKRSSHLRDAEYRERLQLVKKQTERLRKRHGVVKKGPSTNVTAEEAQSLGLLNRAAAAREIGVSIPTLRRRHEGTDLVIFRSELGEYLFKPEQVQALALRRLKELQPAPGPKREAPSEQLDDPIWRERGARLAEVIGAKAYSTTEMYAIGKRIGMKEHLVGETLAAAEGVELVKTNGKWTANRGEK